MCYLPSHHSQAKSSETTLTQSIFSSSKHGPLIIWAGSKFAPNRQIDIGGELVRPTNTGQYWSNVGPSLQTVGQHYSNVWWLLCGVIVVWCLVAAVGWQTIYWSNFSSFYDRHKTSLDPSSVGFMQLWRHTATTHNDVILLPHIVTSYCYHTLWRQTATIHCAVILLPQTVAS